MKISNRTATLFVAAMSLLFLYGKGHTQDLDVPYEPTPYEVVVAMLDLTKVGPGDYVIDLGSGDGRVVIAAAERGAFGHGVDLDPVRVKEAEENAWATGFSDRVVFLQGDLFEADISRASVITMYLLDAVNLRLKPMLFKQLRPGTRIVSNTFTMGDWEADEHIQVGAYHVFSWVMPANLRGRWQWAGNGEHFSMEIEQAFQVIAVDLSAGNRKFQVQDPVVIGERVSFLAVDPKNGNQHVFSGRVEGHSITGTTQFRGDQTRYIENWNATRVRR